MEIKKIKISNDSFKNLLALGKIGIFIEGDIIKLIDRTDLSDVENTYLDTALQKHKNKAVRKKRNIQAILETNNELEKLLHETEQARQNELKAKEEAEEAKEEAENARLTVEKELNIAKTKVQTKLMKIVSYAAMSFIGGATFIAAILYILTLYKGDVNQAGIMGNLVATIFVSVVSSSFAVISTILGVREALKDDKINLSKKV